jgi:enamine deaminase RidA (YjgF/YER057c/UK114 family)
MIPLLLLAAALDYTHVPAIYCADFADCLARLPQGHIVATTVYLADIADYAPMNQVYERRFPGLKPARNTVAASLPRGMRMAINAVVYSGPATPRGLTPPNVRNIVPITPGILTPDKLFIAGILGRDSNSREIPATPAAQIDMCLTRLTNVLATAQLTPAHLDQLTIYHTARIPRELLETRLKLFFGPHLSPAITLLEVPALALGAQVGIHGVASTVHTGV